MDFFSHLLWTYVPTKNKIWRDEALFFAMLPDFGFFLILLYVFFGTSFYTNLSEAQIPPVLMGIYYFLHSFVAFGAVAVIVYLKRPRLLPAMIGWLIHLLIDIPFHEGAKFSTRFLYPITDGYIEGTIWLDWKVLGLTYLALLIVYIYTIRRENKKHRRGKRWKRDWIDRLNRWGEGVIRKKRLPTVHAAREDFEGAPDGLPGEDKDSFSQSEDIPTGAVLHQEGG
jgi:hypothetical protein